MMEKVEIRVLGGFEGTADATRLSPVVLESLARSISAGEPARLRLAFSILGGLRDVFNPDVWELAYTNNDMMLILRYTVAVHGVAAFGGKRLLGPRKYQKEARLYWTRDPRRSEKVWAIIVDEDENVYRPSSAEEAKQLLFDFERELTVPAGKLRRGSSRVWASVNVWWSRHIYSEKGKRKARSREVEIEVG